MAPNGHFNQCHLLKTATDKIKLSFNFAKFDKPET
jgi:hypothetical protein